MPAPTSIAATIGGGATTAEAAMNLATAKVTASVLRTAWTVGTPAFFVLDFGLSLLYLNIHFIARYLGGSRKFCEFGAEWSPRTIMTGKPSFGLKYAEFLALFFLDALAIMIILAIATLLGMVAYAITHPCEFIGKIGYTNALVFAALSGPSAAAVVGVCATVNVVAG